MDHRIVDVAHLVVELTGSRSEITHGPPRAGEVVKLQADPAKIREVTGWAPKFDLAAGLTGNLEWMRENVGRIWPA